MRSGFWESIIVILTTSRQIINIFIHLKTFILPVSVYWRYKTLVFNYKNYV